MLFLTSCVEEQAGVFYAHVFWRALGQSAQAKQGTLILHTTGRINSNQKFTG